MKKAFSYKLYSSKRNKDLHRVIEIASEIYNHSIALHRTYYRLFKKHLNKYQLQKHLVKLKKRPQYAHWNQVGSQAIQDITDRIERGYQNFFKSQKEGKHVSPPSFRKRTKYNSYTLKQAGYKLLENNKIIIGKRIYCFHKSREIEGEIKTVTVKRDALGNIFIYASCDVPEIQTKQTASGKSVGFDFGLKTFLTGSDGLIVKAPEPFKASLKLFKVAGQKLSSKKKGSNNRKRARLNVARVHRKVANQRNDFHFKLARDLSESYDTIYLEDLSMKGMHKLWGRKIADLGFSNFLRILEYICQKSATRLVFIDRFYPSSKECHTCFAIKEDLSLKDREWQCNSCQTIHDRDINAAINIARVGASTHGLGSVRPTQLATAA